MSENNRHDEALARWAESDAPLESPSKLVTGEESRRRAADLLRRVGRPSLSSDQTTASGRSPRRQVRLPSATSELLDAYAEATHTSASDVMREAIDAYLADKRDLPEVQRHLVDHI